MMSILSVGLAILGNLSWATPDPSLTYGQEQFVVTYDCQVPKGVRAYNNNLELTESAKQWFANDYRLQRTFSSPRVLSLAFDGFNRGHLLMPLTGPGANEKQLLIRSGFGYRQTTEYPRRGTEAAIESVSLEFEGIFKPLKCTVTMETITP